MQEIISIQNGVCRMPKWRMAAPVNFSLNNDEQLAIVGPNGGGKTLLVDMLTGKHPLLLDALKYDFAPSTKPMAADNIQYIAFRDTYGGDSDRTYYLQQRWNQQEIDQETPTVRQKLDEAYRLSGEDTPEHRQLRQDIFDMFQLDALLDKYIILLSSGELRKLKLASSLFSSPRVLIIDNPFIGLDATTRDQLRRLLTALSTHKALQIVLVLSKSDDIPEFITHVVEVKQLTVGAKITRETYMATHALSPVRVLSEEKRQSIVALPARTDAQPADIVVQMNKVSIVYGERIILKELDWTVKNGERWALSGQNGAGKSTLLSLVCADNPQSYACDITLFGHARGSGESIWDIKKHIGYVSPEMHRAYRRDMPAIHVVASGLKDSVGLYAKPTGNETDSCRFWLGIFGLQGRELQSFLTLSSGEQRLVLLARAFVKDPELLILDEPLHGLDNYNRQLVKDVIDTFCTRAHKTLIMVTHYQEELPPCIDHSIRLIRHQKDEKTEMSGRCIKTQHDDARADKIL